METQYAIVGGGVLGISIAWGLQRLGQQVVLLDEGDAATRASRGNFGLIWVQGKGDGLPAYTHWTRRSAALWPAFAKELEDATGLDLELSQPGGVDFCLNEQEVTEGVARLERIKQSVGDDYPFEYLPYASLRKMIPEIGSSVLGATYCPEDGHVNPLYLLRALYADFQARGGLIINGCSVNTIVKSTNGFQIDGPTHINAEKVVLTAGLGNRKLGRLVGLDVPVTPNRGQLLICERVAPFIKYPSVQIRQVGEGSIQIGDSNENVGFNDQTTVDITASIANRASKIYPILSRLRVIRTWAALRVMTPDGYPIYQQSSTHPGAYIVTCHSGITLAAIHANVLAKWIAGDVMPEPVESFHGQRFSI